MNLNCKTMSVAVVMALGLINHVTASTLQRVTVKSVRPADSSVAQPVQRYGITRDDAAGIRGLPGVKSVVQIRDVSTRLRYSEREAEATLIGSDKHLPTVVRARLHRGRFLTDDDSREKANVVVVGHALATKLFQDEDPVGRALKSRGQYYRVVGHLAPPEPHASDSERSLANSAVMPLSTMSVRMGDVVFETNRGSFMATEYEISRLEVLLEDPSSALVTRAMVETFLGKQHERDDFEVALTKTSGPNTATPPRAPEQQRPQRNPVVETGVLESAANVPLRTFARGESSIVTLVPEGATVKKGDVLAELSNPAAKETLVKAEAGLIQANVGLKTAESVLKEASAVRDLTSKRAELLVQGAVMERETYFGKDGEHDTRAAKLTREIESAKRAVSLAEQELAGDATNARLAVQLADAVAQLKNTEDAFKLFNGRQKALQEFRFELSIADAKTDARRQKAEVEGELAAAIAQRDAETLKATMAKQRLDLAKKQVASLKLIAPQDGMVYYESSRGARGSTPIIIREGTTVRERQTVLRVVDMSKLQVRVRVHESKIRRVRKGQACHVEFDALPGKSFSATVSSVGNVPVPGAWPNTDLREYEAVVKLPVGNPMLRLGMTCMATFVEE